MEEKPTRKNLRLKEYDYNGAGYYFVTICTKDRECCLGSVVGDADLCVPHFVGRDVLGAPQTELTECGIIVKDCLDYISDYLETYVIMPNHIHAILRFDNECVGGVSRTPRPTNNRLSNVIGYFKRLTNKKIGVNIWQSSFYDHVIRNEQDYHRIWEYIDTNPAKWADDEYYS